jgi:hypothetical protein
MDRMYGTDDERLTLVTGNSIILLIVFILSEVSLLAAAGCAKQIRVH